MYQSRSLSRHFVVADAAPLIYGSTREINYCFPQSLFCLYLPRRPSAASFFAFFSEVDEVWEMGLFCWKMWCEIRPMSMKCKYFQDQITPWFCEEAIWNNASHFPRSLRFVPTTTPKFVWFKSPVELQNLLSRICEYWELCMQMIWERSSVSCAAPPARSISGMHVISQM